MIAKPNFSMDKNAEYPGGEHEPKSRPRDRTAAGFYAIYETLHYAFKHGPLRTIRSLAVVNQKNGIACPSCAWPEPDGARHPAEFCENGAKAIAWEATSKTIGPEFF